MRNLLAGLLLLASLTVFGQTPQQRGVFAEDIDKKVDACTNFFDYANGAWRAANPIPASMQRWSRRWQSGETSKEQLKTLVEDISKRTDYPKGTIDQQIADFYGSCMDEKRINDLGLKPVKPLLSEIRAIQTRADLQRVIGHLHQLQINSPFGITSSPDNHNPTQVIARVYASGLGLPDRDYYLEDAARFVEARQIGRAHV